MALALAWKAAGGAAAVSSDCSAEHAARLKAAGLDVRPGAQDAPAPGGWLAIDGYQFGPDYLDVAKARSRTIVMDDYGNRPRLPADIVLNSNAGSDDFPYAPTDTLVLAGPRYALLRSEFAGEPPPRRRADRPKVLVTLGGADPDNTTAVVLKALAPLKSRIDVIAVIGPDNPHEATLKSLAGDLRRNVKDLRALMLDCDAAVVAGGVTSLECAATGLPMVVLALTENQERQSSALGAAGAAINLAYDRDPTRIAAATLAALATPAMGAAGRGLVDGKGAARVVAALRALSTPKLTAADVTFRPAGLGDLWPVWRIANEPSVRAHAFSTAHIPAETHERWFTAQLKDAKTRFYVLDVAGTIAAPVRYVLDGHGVAEAHFSVASAFRGKGLGKLALSLSMARAAKELGAKKLKALVIEPNDPSARSFLSAGYTRAGSTKERGRDCAVFEASC
jgi:spore coat polysaccharide biosynthesis predicted glycosyltransferase SpsG/RimJ/RimL family protein N-acetyltransferase